jgi:hypothetical protein
VIGGQMGAKSDQRLPGASRAGQPSPTRKPGAAELQDPRSVSVAPVHQSGARLAEATNLAGAGEQAAEAVALTHELVEALTATGNYLAAATRILEVERRPPEDTLGEVLEKSLTQFTRAVEAVRRLRATISSITPSRE